MFRYRRRRRRAALVVGSRAKGCNGPAAAFRRGNPPPPAQTVLADDAHPRSPSTWCQRNRRAIGCATRRRRGETAPRPPPWLSLRQHPSRMPMSPRILGRAYAKGSGHGLREYRRILREGGQHLLGVSADTPRGWSAPSWSIGGYSERVVSTFLEYRRILRKGGQHLLGVSADTPGVMARPLGGLPDTPRGRCDIGPMRSKREPRRRSRRGLPPPPTSCAADSTAVALAPSAGRSGTGAIGEHCLSRRRGVAAPKSRRRAFGSLRAGAASESESRRRERERELPARAGAASESGSRRRAREPSAARREEARARDDLEQAIATQIRRREQIRRAIDIPVRHHPVAAHLANP
jgi:hypothetical protein